MKSIFLDTSSLVKVYHREPDSDNILKTLPEFQRIILSEITKIEFISAFRKKVNRSEATETEAKDAIRFFENDYNKFHWVVIDSKIIHSAKNLLNDYSKIGLRTLDAIQLACAVSVKDITDENLTSDKILKNIFLKEGLISK